MQRTASDKAHNRLILLAVALVLATLAPLAVLAKLFS
jgi:hypothetical protein